MRQPHWTTLRQQRIERDVDWQRESLLDFQASVRFHEGVEMECRRDSSLLYERRDAGLYD